jgi:double-stranded uracil-DNA glycosylase
MTHSQRNESSAGFPPITAADARILILGSLPGQKSLAATEYYAHRQNAFWGIMSALLGVSGDYQSRCGQLTRERIAVWDVLASSVRPGSMDADIRLDSAQPNDFAKFLAEHTGIERIGFNGRKAEQLFRRLVMPNLEPPLPQLISLPSTSPAYAAMSFNDKLEAWASRLELHVLSTRGRE